MLDASPLGGASATVTAADQNVVRLALCNPCRHYAHPNLADQLHTDSSIRVGVLQVKDELRQVLD